MSYESVADQFEYLQVCMGATYWTPCLILDIQESYVKILFWDSFCEDYIERDVVEQDRIRKEGKEL